MRTKALLWAAGILAAGAATSMAQNVYSLNVVGYINNVLTNGNNLLANHLDSDGNLTNNGIYGVFSTNMPNLTKVSAFTPGSGFVSSTFSTVNHAWGQSNQFPAIQAALAPGHGVVVTLQSGAGTPTPITLTTVGNVVQGSHNIAIVGGPATTVGTLQLVSIIPPISTGIQTGMGYVPSNLDKAQLWLQFAVPQHYVTRTYSTVNGLWNASAANEPKPGVGESFFIDSRANKTWTQNFTVQ